MFSYLFHKKTPQEVKPQLASSVEEKKPQVTPSSLQQSNPPEWKAKETPSKRELLPLFKEAWEDKKNGLNLNNFRFLTNEQKGTSHKQGDLGGFYIGGYLDKSGKMQEQKIFFKQSRDKNRNPNHREDIAGLVGGQIMNAVVGDNAASTFFAVAPEGKIGYPDAIYIGSIVYDNFQCVHTAAHEAMGLKKDEIPPRGKGPGNGQDIDNEVKLTDTSYFGYALKGNYGGTPSFKPGLIKLIENMEKALPQNSEPPGYTLGKVLASSLLIGNYQMHGENIGVATAKNGRNEFVAIDFSGSFRRSFHRKTIMGYDVGTEENSEGEFEGAFDPESYNNLKYATSYFLGYPEAIRYSDAFLNGIESITQVDKNTLKKSIDASIDEAVKYYGQDCFIKDFSATLKKYKGKAPLNVDETKAFLLETLLSRQQSLKSYVEKCRLKTADNKNVNTTIKSTL